MCDMAAMLDGTVSTTRRKMALVIGNQLYYQFENILRHPVNDADDVSTALRNLKFNVRTAHNLTKSQMLATIIKFAEAINDGDLVVFYFSAHGYQINGRNYLMHIDDHLIETNEDIEKHSIRLDYCLHLLTSKNPTFATIFILDCCRQQHPKSNNKRFLADTTMEAPLGTYIAFACSPYQTASDGSYHDRNGLFAKHLLKHIGKPNKDVTHLFRTVTNGVCIESKQNQKPVRLDGLTQLGKIYLNDNNRR